MDFPGGCILVYVRIQLQLVQHWIHVYVCMWRLVVQTAETAESPVAVFLLVVNIPFVMEKQISMVQILLATRAIPVSVRSWVIDVPSMQVVQVLPSCWPVGCHDRWPAYVPQLPIFKKVIDITVVAQRPFPLVQ